MGIHLIRIGKIAAVCAIIYGSITTAIAQEGTLTVKTDPEGIEVWLNDQFLGQSPIIEKKIKTGRYALKLVDPTQHTSMNEEVLIQENQETVVDRSVTSKFGSLRVTSQPEGAEVAIATELGKTPVANDFMNPGRYRLEIRPANSRYIPKITEVTITKGETVSIDETLKKRSAISKKNIAALCLTGGAIGGFVWGLIEQGNYKAFKERTNPRPQDRIDGAALGRTLGIIIGSSCTIGVGIIALF
jgi:hypothetical protein